MYSTTLGVAICLSFPPGFKGNKWPRSVNFLTIFDTVFDVTPVQEAIAEKLSQASQRFNIRSRTGNETILVFWTRDITQEIQIKSLWPAL